MVFVICFILSLCLVVLQANEEASQIGKGSFYMLPGWYYPGNGYQYSMTSRKMTYMEANEECRGWGGTLAQNGIRDRFYYRKLADHFGTPCWIGLDDRSHERRYNWADKRPINLGWFRPWFFFRPDHRTDEDCVIMGKRSCNFFQLPMMFDDVSCDKSYFGLCERSIGTPPQYNFTAADGSMYTLITSETTFSVAKEMCKEWGGKLAEKPITNQLLARTLVARLYNDPELRILNSWVGLTDSAIEGNFRLNSGNPINLLSVNWNSKRNTQSRDCATFNPRQFGSVRLENCLLKKTVLCEKSNKSYEQIQSPECLPQHQACKIDGYRSIEGTCHNLLNSDRGREKRPFKRMLPADYDDPNGTPRGGAPSRLPSARAITQGLKGSTEPPSLFASHQLPLWGQFLAHDLTKLGELKDKNGALLLHCPCGDTNQECFNIPIPTEDPVRQQMECYSFLRAERVPDVDCETRTREQENRVTSYIDASNVYGSNPLFFNNLRTGRGLLKIGNYNARNHYDVTNLPLGDQVPRNVHSQFECEPIHFDFTNTSCFAGGDIRVNEHAGLASGHTTWLRKHNQIATELGRLNPHWDSDKIFWTARSIIAAINQQISFNEFFPLILGEKNINRFGLKLTQKSFYYGFDANYDSTIDISFATAAFRMGHTLINGILSRFGSNFSTDPNLPPIDLRSRFFDTTPLLRKEGASSVLRGMVTDHAMNFDTSFTSALTDHLFARAGEFGRDLPAINIQRGRDHGIPSYLAHRRFCGLSTATRFEDLEDIPPQNQAKLKQLYRTTEDIDLFPGGIAELPRDNSSGVPGPTFACIIAYQARDLRKGDRFWFENGGPESRFTFNQLQSIKKVTLSRIICDVGENITKIQPKAMMQHTIEGNGRVNCSSLPELDLSPFQESQNGYLDASRNGYIAEKDYEWSVWFPYSITNSEKVPLKLAPPLLRHLRVYRPDDVCDEVAGTKVRKINGFFQVRYKCPPGAIKATDFPPVDSKEVYWTQWSNQNSPNPPYYDDYEGLSGSRACLYPVAVQAQTVEGTPARETGDVFEMFSPFQGLFCKGIHQRRKRCHDYRVRYLCLRN